MPDTWLLIVLGIAWAWILAPFFKKNKPRDGEFYDWFRF